MKRFAVLALAAVFAFSFSANVAAAPVFSGEFSVESEATVTEDSGINFSGSPDATLSLSAAEEGLWSLSVELGSVAPGGVSHTAGIYVGDDGDSNPVYAVSFAGPHTSPDYYKTADGTIYDDTLAVVDTVPDGTEFTDYISAEDHDLAQVELGKYYLNVTPGPFGLAAWGNSYELSDVASAFDFIKSAKKATDPKFRLTTSQMGVDITVDYDTDGNDALYAFAKTGMVGVAFQDENVVEAEEGMGVSADVTADLGIATITAGGAFDLNAEEDKGSMAFGVTAESEVAAGLTVNGGYTSDGRTFDEDTPETEITAGATYTLDSIEVGGDLSLATAGDTELKTTTIGGDVSYGDYFSGGVEYATTDEDGDETPTLTFEAAVEEYPVIADVFTVSADFLMVNDKEPIGAGKDYRWVENRPSSQRTIIGDDVVTVMEIGVSADYKLIPEFTLTPGFEYRAYTFLDDGTATATILSLDAAYEVSDSAEISFGVEKVKGETADLPVGVSIPDEDYTVLSTGITVNF